MSDRIFHSCIQDSVTSIDVSDHEILVGCADGRARRYDLRNGQLLTDFVGAQITGVAFTRDGQCLLVGTSDDALRLFDKSTGEMLQEYTGHRHRKYRIDCTMDKSDQFVLSGSENGSVYAWDMVEGTMAAKLNHDEDTPEDKSTLTVHSLSSHPSKTALLTAAKTRVFMWRASEEEMAADEDDRIEIKHTPAPWEIGNITSGT